MAAKERANREQVSLDVWDKEGCQRRGRQVIIIKDNSSRTSSAFSLKKLDLPLKGSDDWGNQDIAERVTANIVSLVTSTYLYIPR